MWQNLSQSFEELDNKIIELIETDIKYEGYISKQWTKSKKMKPYGGKRIPTNTSWNDIDSITDEARQKFN